MVAPSFIDLCAVFLYLKLYKRIDRVKSNTAYSDLQFLFLAARDGWGQGCIVEIGAYHGKSAIAMALGAKQAKREKVTSIDHHRDGTRAIFFSNLAKLGVSDYVEPGVCTSEEARRGFHKKIRLLFIDAGHDYLSVENDVSLWQDLVIDGGIIAFHDYTREGVARAIRELTAPEREFSVKGATGCTMFVQKGLLANEGLYKKIRFFNRMKRILQCRFNA